MTTDKLTIAEYEKFNPVFNVPFSVGENGATQKIELSFFVPNMLVAWRVNTLLTKEPDTIEWIKGFEAGEVFYDIGANIGLYSLWATASRGVQTFAFEPEAQNYHVLNRNIYFNQLSDRIRAFAVAVSDQASFDALYLNQAQDKAGGANHNFAEKVNCHHEPMVSNFSQGCFSVALDDLVYAQGLPKPAHIKIDVDGIEHKIMAGAQRLLQDEGLRSLHIELNEALSEDLAIIQQLTDMGFTPRQGSRGTSPGLTSMVNYTFER